MPKDLIGKVISVKMQKTIVVEVEKRRSHPLYKKMLKKNKHYKVDYQDTTFAVGDMVKIQETRPQSKGKKWKALSKI